MSETIKTIKIHPKSPPISLNSESLLLLTHSIGFKYSQACGYLPISINFSTSEAHQSFLTFPHNFILNYTRFLLFGQIAWLLMYCGLQIRLFYGNAFPITTRNVGEICWAVIGVGLIIAIRIKRLVNRENTLALWADMNLVHKKVLQNSLNSNKIQHCHMQALKENEKSIKNRVILCIGLLVTSLIVNIVYKICLPVFQKDEKANFEENAVDLIWATFAIMHSGHAIAFAGFMNFFTTCFQSLADSFSSGDVLNNIECKELLKIFKELEALVTQFNVQHSFDFSATTATCTLQILLSLFNLVIAKKIDDIMVFLFIIFVLATDLYTFCNRGSQMTGYALRVVELFEKLSVTRFDSDLKNQVRFIVVFSHCILCVYEKCNLVTYVSR